MNDDDNFTASKDIELCLKKQLLGRKSAHFNLTLPIPLPVVQAQSHGRKRKFEEVISDNANDTEDLMRTKIMKIN